jgi:Flp pilus assembly protein TadG
MSRLAKKIVADARGASAVEFALSAGILVMLLVGIAQIGILFMANAGLRHAVGEGARLSTIFPTPDDAAIVAMVTSARFGVNPAYITDGPTVTHDVENGASYTEVSMTYTVPLNFVFFQVPGVTLTETRRAFAGS